MNKFYLIFIFSIFSNVIYSQSNLTGQVLSVNTPLSNVEIINSTKKNVVKSDEKGEFQIQAELNDEIVFFLKGYLQKTLNVSKEYLNGHIKIALDKKVIELDEVKIVKAPKVKIVNDYESLKMAKIAKEQSQPKVIGVYTGGIPNGIDFIAIGDKLVGLVGKLFKKDSEEKSISEITFEECVSKHYDNKTLIEKLKLSDDNLILFMEFCKSDINVKNVISNNNELDVLDFLMKKRKEFKSE